MNLLNANVSATLLAQGNEQDIQRTAVRTYARALDRKHPMSEAQAENVAQDFEATFLAQMFGTMFGDSTGDSLFGNAETKDVYKGLLMNEYGKSMASLGGIGIASQVKREILKLQEV